MDKDKAGRNLKEIVDKLHNDTDIKELDEYSKLYKKEISLFKRSWTAAWLFMYYDKRENPKISSQENLSNKKNAYSKDVAAVSKPVYSKSKPANEKQAVEINLSEDESKRLFISIGKNRRLFPREVITLIMTRTKTAREDIGMIRILDNYSFVQVRDTKADEIIEKLSGCKFHGRTLAVNYAKPKSTENDDGS